MRIFRQSIVVLGVLLISALDLAAQAVRIYGSGTYAEIAAWRWRDVMARLPFLGVTLPHVFAMFLLGVYIARRGIAVAVHNRTPARMHEFMSEYSHEGDFTGAETLGEFIDALERPRRIIIMVKAGAPVTTGGREALRVMATPRPGVWPRAS